MKHPFVWGLPPFAPKRLVEHLGRHAMGVFSLRKALDRQSPTPDEEVIIVNDPGNAPSEHNPPGDAVASEGTDPVFPDPEPAPPVPVVDPLPPMPPAVDEKREMAMEARSGPMMVGGESPMRPAFTFPDAFTRSTITVQEALDRVKSARAELRSANARVDEATARLAAAEQYAGEADAAVDEAMEDSVNAVEAHRLVVENWLAKYAYDTTPEAPEAEEAQDESPAP